jgi:transposase
VLECVQVPAVDQRWEARPVRSASDNAYDAQWIGDYLQAEEIEAVIPRRGSETPDPTEFDRERYRGRNVIERLVGRLKECRRIFSRFENAAVSYLGMLKLAMIRYYLKQFCPKEFSNEAWSERIKKKDVAMTNRDERISVEGCSRREAMVTGGLIAAGVLGGLNNPLHAETPTIDPRPWVAIRGLYGGFPKEILERGKTPQDYGVNAIWVGSGSLKKEEVARYHELGLKVFAEFNSMHAAEYLKEHPDAAPIGADGRVSPPPQGWQGVSPFHAGYRRNRMDEFRRVLETFEIDGIWLDYHHAHASWERDEPDLPDTDFSAAALQQFTKNTGIQLPADVPAAARLLLGEHRDAWTQFRCDVFTDWVREYREILNATRPRALLGTFHCPWSQTERDGAIRHKLAIDLPAQAKYLDVLSIMPYHARFGHSQDPAWISRCTADLGKLLELTGQPNDKQKIWPIVQLSDWGEKVPESQIPAIVEHGARRPATGIMAFHWSGISREWNKLEALGAAYRALRSA